MARRQQAKQLDPEVVSFANACLDSLRGANMDCCTKHYELELLAINRGSMMSSLLAQFQYHFSGCGWYVGTFVTQAVIMDYEIMVNGIKTQAVHPPTDFGFEIIDCPGVDDVIMATHLINGKLMSMKRIVLINDLPKSVTEAKFKKFFSKFGEIVDHEIVNDEYCLSSNYGLLVFDSDQAVNDLVEKGWIKFGRTRVRIYKAVIHKAHVPFGAYGGPPVAGVSDGHSASFTH